ncbi:glycosyltransferase family 4 protein [uncultured Methanoregula sp.]|uniref:glycosyltransferase family 4 protein n=1 Tax=uncultured Methanoregula sp. TaxID=1005933 RepID=UPI002AAAC042|nr:glycosyltransferase family 4 protein [uncultured Methanoregula sp.]
MHKYTLGLFSNMYPPGLPKNPGEVILTDTTRGIFVKRMVDDLVRNDVLVKMAVKRSGSLTGYPPFLWQSLCLARDRDLDIMQAEYIPHSSLVPALFGRKNCPLVLKFHGDDARIFPFKNSFCMSLTRTMIRKSDHILTASDDIRTILISLGAIPEKISALHSGVDTTFFSPLPREVVRQKMGLSPDAMVFLFIGRLHAWKGLNEIVSVAERCPWATFVFIGPGTIPPHTENCRFVGSLQPESVRDWYNAADCLLLPTYTDAVPTSVMEAFSCGIPAIVTNIGGCPEIVEDKKNGLIIPVRDVPALYDAVIWMRDHPDERRNMGKSARVTVKERYDHTKMVEMLIGIHQDLICGR